MFDWQAGLTVIAIIGASGFVGIRAWQRIRSLRVGSSAEKCIAGCHGCSVTVSNGCRKHVTLRRS